MIVYYDDMKECKCVKMCMVHVVGESKLWCIGWQLSGACVRMRRKESYNESAVNSRKKVVVEGRMCQGDGDAFKKEQRMGRGNESIEK